MDRDAGIAQLVEQLICNHQVPCSNHGAGTTPSKQKGDTFSEKLCNYNSNSCIL